MSVVRVNKTKNFTVMSNHHFKERGMSLKAKGLLSLMLSLPDNWDYSIAGLVKLSKDGKDSVMTALAELEEFGYLTRSRTTDNKGRFSGVEYQIYEAPQPLSENQHSDKQQEENTNEENPPQLNNKELNKKELNKKELKTKKEEEPNGSSYKEVLTDIDDTDLKQLYIDYIEMRRTINSPISARALSMLIDRCDRISGFDINLQKEMLEAAIINNWKSVYLPKDKEEKKENSRVFNREQRYSNTGYDALKNFKLE